MADLPAAQQPAQPSTAQLPTQQQVAEQFRLLFEQNQQLITRDQQREAQLQELQLRQAAGAASKRTPQPDKFSGDSARGAVETLDWCFTMDGHLRVHGLFSAAEAIQTVGLFLTGSARTWWRALYEEAAAAGTTPFANWDAMRAALLLQFSSSRSGKEAYNRLIDLQQESSSARDYTRRFRELALQCDKQLATPGALLFHFKNGLRTELRTYVETQDPATLQRATELAEAVDEAHSYSQDLPAEQHVEGQQRSRSPAPDTQDSRPARNHSRSQHWPLPQRQSFRSPFAHQPPANLQRGPAPMELGAVERTGTPQRARARWRN